MTCNPNGLNDDRRQPLRWRLIGIPPSDERNRTMTHRLLKPRTSPAGARSTASMLLSLANSLDTPRGPLGRSATAIAHRLVDGACTRADHDTAATLLCQLL